MRLLCRGLPAYLMEMKPWTQPEQESLSKALAHLVDDRRLFAGRVARAILDYGGDPDPGPFPLKYTGLNDVSLRYLIYQVIESLHEDMEVLQSISAQLEGLPRLHALSEEILGNTKGHAEILGKVCSGQWTVDSG